MFETLQFICESTSALQAKNYCQLTTGRIPSIIDERTLSAADMIEERDELIVSHVRNQGLGILSESITSSWEDRGEAKTFTIFITFFGYNAPKLLTASNELGRMFALKVELKNGIMTVVLASNPEALDSPNTFMAAMFTLTGRGVYAVDRSGDLIHKEGIWQGGAFRQEEGWGITAIVEQQTDLITLVHEVIHAKWPSEKQQQDQHVDRFAETIIRKIEKSGKVKLQIAEEVELERQNALKAFNVLERDLRDLVPLGPSM